MPRYFLHVCNGIGFAEDQDGQELADDAAAREAAILGIRDIMATEIRRGGLDMSSFVEVEDAQGQLLFTVSFEDAIAITHRHGPPPVPGVASRRRS